MTQVMVRQHILLEGSDIGGPHFAEKQALSLNNVEEPISAPNAARL